MRVVNSHAPKLVNPVVLKYLTPEKPTTYYLVPKKFTPCGRPLLLTLQTLDISGKVNLSDASSLKKLQRCSNTNDLVRIKFLQCIYS